MKGVSTYFYSENLMFLLSCQLLYMDNVGFWDPRKARAYLPSQEYANDFSFDRPRRPVGNMLKLAANVLAGEIRGCKSLQNLYKCKHYFIRGVNHSLEISGYPYEKLEIPYTPKPISL